MNAQTKKIRLITSVEDLTPEQMVDELGELKAAIQPLKDAQAELEKRIKASGKSEIDGKKYRATVSTYNKVATAWKKVAMKLKPSPQLKAAHTSSSQVTTLKVVALKAN